MLISVIRTFLLYIAIIFAVKLMGKRQISELQTSELVVTLLLSDIAAIPMQNTAQPLLSGLIPMLILIFCEIAVSVLMVKYTKFRKLVCGKPQVVIENGVVQQQQMRKLRMSIEDLMEQLRQANVFTLEDVDYAIIETNGQLSVLEKPEKKPPTAELMGISPPDNEFETVVINDGDFFPYSAQLCGVNLNWVLEKLRKNKLSQKEVFIMTVNKQKEYNIILREIEE